MNRSLDRPKPPGRSYEEKGTLLGPGEGVLFYTDGLVEVHDPRGEMYGTPRLRGLLSERTEGGRGLSATLIEELERFTGEGWEQEDDITLLTLERFRDSKPSFRESHPYSKAIG